MFKHTQVGGQAGVWDGVQKDHADPNMTAGFSGLSKGFITTLNVHNDVTLLLWSTGACEHTTIGFCW